MTFPLSKTDGYKLSHKKFMIGKTTRLVANMTPRSGRYMSWMDSQQRVVVLGIQKFISDFLVSDMNEFFSMPKVDAIAYWKRRVGAYLGSDKVSMAHFEALHDLGYMPLRVRALPEGTKSNLKVPFLIVENTHDDFAWLVTFIETVMSSEVWPVVTAATTAYQYLTLCNRFADETVGNRLHVPFQCHDFSARGLMGNAAEYVGLGHLASFLGSDSVAALETIERCYNVDAQKVMIGTSVPASEHAVTSLGIAQMGEYETLQYWITVAYPTGIVSLVSDTIDYWKVLTKYLPELKGDILNRKPDEFGFSKVVIRPDSGDPVRIICGYREDEVYRDTKKVLTEEGFQDVETIYDRATNKILTPDEVKGSIELLWETFGGTINALGYRELDSHIGLIYGDSITIDRALEIFSRLQQRGFASNCVVFGVGSYTYQYVTRDTLGIAVKVTAALVDDKWLELSKDPATDDGTKKSAKGLLRVEYEDGKFVLYDQQTPDQALGGELRIVFEDDEVYDEDWVTIRNRLHDIVEA